MYLSKIPHPKLRAARRPARAAGATFLLAALKWRAATALLMLFPDDEGGGGGRTRHDGGSALFGGIWSMLS